jgi:hAT family C-terminal dimerisation region
MLLKSKTSPDYEPKEHEATVECIKDIFRTQVQETEEMEVDSPSFLNEGMDESAWAKVPSFVSEPTRYTPLPRDVSPIEQELDTWLKRTPRTTTTDIDILAYWKEKEKDLPLLAKVARKYYGIPVTSACSERLFSAAGNVITSSRTLLNTERAEQLIYIHENYWVVEPTIKKWQLRSDKERGKDRPKPPLSQVEEDVDVDDPIPSTSSQSLLQTPRSSKPPSKKAKSSARRPVLLDSDSYSD